MEIKGYTYGYGATRGVYPSEAAFKSREALIDIGINWVCLAFSVKQDHYYSTDIMFDYRTSVPDLELITTIQHFHDKGVKVCLKPMIDCKDGVWRALISFPEQNMFNKDQYWPAWFESYSAFLTHYAQIAEYCGCEMFCLGCEMLGTERQEALWRETISKVRGVYSGKLTYNTNHGKETVAQWYDAIDYVGTSAYYPVADGPNATAADMKLRWASIADNLETISKQLNKKILFMEIGCRSAAGCATMPWDFMHREFPYSEEEQANFYESCLDVFSSKDWFAGFFWWDWSPTIYSTREDALQDANFNIYLKKTESVVRDFYSKL